MPLPPLAIVSLAPGVAAALDLVPSCPGVGQVVGRDERSLVVGTAANLRRWAAAQLGRGPKPRAGKRPKTDLSSIAVAIRFAPSRGPFHQRLVYERLMAPLVPLAKRRDLKPAAFLHLDPSQRFPRVSVAAAEADTAALFGPFRDRRAAEKARDVVQRLFPLRPCDLQFEPDEQLSLGLGCLYAQVRSCAAPCLKRVDEAGYRELAQRAVLWLADPLSREHAPSAVPEIVAAARGSRLLVVDPGDADEIGLYPVSDGRVVDAAARRATAASLVEELRSLQWPPPCGPSDWPWLLSWLRGAAARRRCLPLGRHDADAAGVEQRVRTALRAPERPGSDGKVEATRRSD